MTSTLKTTEIVDAAVALINAAVGTTITFTPAIVMEGDLGFYAENPEGVTLEVPAVFVKATRVDLQTIEDGPIELVGTLTHSETVIRVLIVDEWDQPDDLEQKRVSHAQEVAQAFLDSDDLDLDASIPGYTVIPPSTATRMEFRPPEHGAVSMNQQRQLFAVAVTVEVRGRAART